jgi:hypothetical protein
MTETNRYAPPRVAVSDVQQKSHVAAKKSALPIWLCALYCTLTGASHLIVLGVAM